VAIISEDAPMDDPDVQRFWLRVDLVLLAVIVVGAIALTVAALT
jgi:hypothetical protein